MFSASASAFAPMASSARTASAPAEERGQVQRREAVAAAGVQAELVDVAERGRLQRSDVRAGREQRVAHVGPAVIEREQERGDTVLVAGVGEPGLVRQAADEIVEVHLGSVAMLSNSELADKLHSAAIHLLRGVRREDAAAGLPPAQLSALSVVVFGGPLTLGRLAEAEQVRSPTMTRIVTSLETAGLVTREPHPDDARSTLVAATAAGRDLLLEGRRRRVSRPRGANRASSSRPSARRSPAPIDALEAVSGARDPADVLADVAR